MDDRLSPAVSQGPLFLKARCFSDSLVLSEDCAATAALNPER
jgi:hypothetical protein